VKRPSGGISPDVASSVHVSANAALAADRRFGMTKRIGQSRRHGHSDPGSTDRVHTASESPVNSRPTLRLVGGTDVTAEPVDPRTAFSA
jgi:hypothetical protein